MLSCPRPTASMRWSFASSRHGARTVPAAHVPLESLTVPLAAKNGNAHGANVVLLGEKDCQSPGRSPPNGFPSSGRPLPRSVWSHPRMRGRGEESELLKLAASEPIDLPAGPASLVDAGAKPGECFYRPTHATSCWRISRPTHAHCAAQTPRIESTRPDAKASRRGALTGAKRPKSSETRALFAGTCPALSSADAVREATIHRD